MSDRDEAKHAFPMQQRVLNLDQRYMQKAQELFQFPFRTSHEQVHSSLSEALAAPPVVSLRKMIFYKAEAIAGIIL